MAFLDRHPKLHHFLHELNMFFQNPYISLKGFVVNTAKWLWRKLVAAFWGSGSALRRHWTGVCVGIAVVLIVVAVVVGGLSAFAMWWDSRMAPVMEPPQQVVYLDQGWGGTSPASDERLDYYYLPQGAFLKNIRYDWMAHLERPWKEERFVEPKYMRAYGFIVDPAQTVKNPGALPVGFAPRYDPKYNEMMLDLNCSVCHTGELQVVRNNQRIAVRVDGGSGHQDFTGQKPGQFAGDLAMSLLFTRINWFKWRRFASAVLGDQDNSDTRAQLRGELTNVLWDLITQAVREKRRGIHPYPDGYGRTDGLGGIMNAAFAVNLDHDNYRVANAPVSYPFVWDIPWLDWVQYTASVRQPMARNIGEAMGTGARYYLKDPFDRPLPASERFDASLKLANLQQIESLLRTLRAPCWPEDLFGNIDTDLAAKGWDLFHNKYHCVNCHGPHELPAVYTASEAPLKLQERNPLVNPQRSRTIGGPPPETWQIPPGTKPPYRLAHWYLKALPAEQIGTDVTSALNFFRYRVDLTKTGMTAKEVRDELTPYWTTNYKRQIEYWSNLVILVDDTGNQPALLDATGNAPGTKPYGTLRRYDTAAISTMRAAQMQFLLKSIASRLKMSSSDLGDGSTLGVDPEVVAQASFRQIAKERMQAALAVCQITAPTLDLDDYYLGAPIQLTDLQDMSPDQLALLGNPTLDGACGNLRGLLNEGLQNYIDRNLGPINLASVSGGAGLNYLITLVRKRAYQDMDVRELARVEQMDGYGQIDTPASGVQYHARPLAGIWATAPFLHNGSVPSLYDLLRPAYERPKKFYLKTPNFDTHAVGLYADGSEPGAFLFDTTVPGNSNAGHEFRKGYREKDALGSMPMNGVIGPEMTDDERWAIIEYLKIKRDIYDPVCPETNYVMGGKAVHREPPANQAPPAPSPAMQEAEQKLKSLETTPQGVVGRPAPPLGTAPSGGGAAAAPPKPEEKKK